MKGWRSVVFFTAVSGLGIVAMIEAADLKVILLPLLCQIDQNGPEVMNDCTRRVIEITGGIMIFVGTVGKILRFITTTPILRAEIKPADTNLNK